MNFENNASTWDEDDFNKKMILQTDDFAKLSKDQSTKVGASLLREEDYQPLWGYNGMVRGANDVLLYRNERPEKYLWTEHAERNLLFNEARKFIKGKMIFCSSFPSIIEARAIAATGIVCLITVLPKLYSSEYEMYVNRANLSELSVTEDIKNFARVNQILKENGVKIVYPLINSDDLASVGINLTKTDLDRMSKYKVYLEIVQGYAKRWSSIYTKEKAAALILDTEDYTPVSWGINDLPTRFKSVATQLEKEEKLFYIPAVANAIYATLKQNLKNSTLFASWCPCLDCSMAASEVGVSKVVSKLPDFNLEADARWQVHFENSLSFYKRIGMKTVFYSYESLDETRKSEE